MSKIDRYREEQLKLLGDMMKPMVDREPISLDDLADLEDPVVLFEHQAKNSDGVMHYVYTLGGRIKGKEVAGVTVGGDCVVVHGRNRMEADRLAVEGLEETITMLRAERTGKKQPLEVNAGMSVISEVSKRSH
jgi:hypothetical protein